MQLPYQTVTPPDTILPRVFARIEAVTERRARYRRAFDFVLVAFLLAVSVYFCALLVRGLNLSGFSAYVSLAFTDTNIVFAHLGTFVLSLVGTLPVLPLLAVALSSYGMLMALRAATRTMRPGYQYQ